MIVFLESDKNNFTTYFNPPIKAHRVRLISCSLYNSWYNLIGGGVPSTPLDKKTIPDGHYTPITLAKELAKYDYTLTTGLPHEMTFKQSVTGTTMFKKDNPLLTLLGIGRTLNGKTAVPVKWKVASSYEVHCDLVKSYNNGGISSLMSKFPPKGNPFDLVEYEPISLSYDLSSNLISEVQITIKVDGKTVDFNGRNINLVLSFT